MKRYLKLSFTMKLAVILVFVLLGITRLAIIVIPFKHLSKLLGRKNESTESEEKHERLIRAAKIGWIVETMSKFTPWESKCLVKAITAQLLLRVIGVSSTLYLGVAKDDSNQLIAHAWLRCGQLILTGANEAPRFKVVGQFASLQRTQAYQSKGVS